MEGQLVRPGVKQTFTWSTPFFDVTFVDIKTKKGNRKLNKGLQALEHLQPPTQSAAPVCPSTGQSSPMNWTISLWSSALHCTALLTTLESQSKSNSYKWPRGVASHYIEYYAHNLRENISHFFNVKIYLKYLMIKFWHLFNFQHMLGLDVIVSICV